MIASIGVCTHPARRHQALLLAAEVGADAIATDDGRGSNLNHARTWELACEANPGTEWVGVLEDDAIPVDGFTDQLNGMLAHSPAPLVSAYLGTGFPVGHQATVREALRTEPRWIVSTDVHHHVALFARRECVPAIINRLQHAVIGCDAALGVEARRNAWPVAYCVPSLVDHDDGPALVPATHRTPSWNADTPRKAWVTGSADWSTGPTVLLDRATQIRYGGRYGR